MRYQRMSHVPNKKHWPAYTPLSRGLLSKWYGMDFKISIPLSLTSSYMTYISIISYSLLEFQLITRNAHTTFFDMTYMRHIHYGMCEYYACPVQLWLLNIGRKFQYVTNHCPHIYPGFRNGKQCHGFYRLALNNV